MSDGSPETPREPWRPFVHVKAGMSLDGRIATASGESQWITSEEARLYAHRLRKQYDAILVGVGTVLADDPQLNVRLPGEEGGSIHRVVVDSRLRTPPEARMFGIEAGGEILIAALANADARRRMELEKAGAVIIACPEKDGRVDLVFLLRTLKGKGIATLLVEGGGEIIASFLREHLVDKVTFVYAPMIIGGRRAIPAVAGDELEHLADALKVRDLRCFPLGPDIAIEGRF
jgi:diaminohydroxyphosphoribosylaminopyrimidine deaminase/5-amino-6-(5-phosphoribosylamino)uracil reductase